MIKRRFFTIGALVVITLLLVILAPALVLMTLMASLVPALRTAPHSLVFVYWFVICEWTGLVRFAWVCLRYRNSSGFLLHLRDIQFWWAQALFDMGRKIFQLKIEVRGDAALAGPCALLLSRHTSMADTVLPLLYFGKDRM